MSESVLSCGCSTGSSLESRKGCSSTRQGLLDHCHKLTVFDWLSEMEQEDQEGLWVEVRFKNTRKEYYYNSYHLPLNVGDYVVVEANPGKDVGMITAKGYMAELQMIKKGIKVQPEATRKVIRKVKQPDLDLWNQARSREYQTLLEARKIAREMNLEMKISDVEFQADNTKAIFYYIADQRVDFRELIKVYARQFHIRVEMKQIGTRQEAALVGGIGSCGRELCCSTWLTDFRSVTTAAVRYQQLSLNPQKLAGQCGKLKCCLNYELDHYVDALKVFPDMERRTLRFSKQELVWFKNDIFKHWMWFYQKDQITVQYAITLEKVNEILELNRKGVFPEEIPTAVSTSGDTSGNVTETQEPEFMQVLDEQDRTSLDARIQHLKKHFQKTTRKKRFQSGKKNKEK